MKLLGWQYWGPVASQEHKEKTEILNTVFNFENKHVPSYKVTLNDILTDNYCNDNMEIKDSIQ